MHPSSSFLETIRLEDGKFHFLSYHQTRFDQTRAKFCAGEEALSLASCLEVPKKYQQGLFKVRVLYGCKIEQISYEPYQIRSVKTLKLINADDLVYDAKYANRTEINTLFEQRGHCDDVLLVKNGLLTDTSYANVILSDGRHWYTPAKPLLAGTGRARLLELGIIIPVDIYQENLNDFQELRLINAMMGFEEGPRVAMDNIS